MNMNDFELLEEMEKANKELEDKAEYYAKVEAFLVEFMKANDIEELPISEDTVLRLSDYEGGNHHDKRETSE